jgi:hypothetical protein
VQYRTDAPARIRYCPAVWRQNMRRREFFKQAGVASAALVSLPALAHALTRPVLARSPLGSRGQPASPFSVLLSGTYKPVKNGAALGLSGVNLNDGSYSTTKIFPVSGLSDEDRRHDAHDDRQGDRDNEAAIGDFFVQFSGNKVAYDLAGGALAMIFTANNLKPAPDGQGGTYLVGTLDLTITDATGIFQSFIGGHNGMVDILHHLANGTFVEHCFCVISRP